MTGLGVWLLGPDVRRRRAAGAAWFVATDLVFASAWAFAEAIDVPTELGAVLAAIAALAVSVAFRWVYPALMTQLSVLLALTALTASTLAWLRSTLAADPNGLPAERVPAVDPLLLLVVEAAAWIATAVLIGWLGLRESANATADPGAGRRAGLTRLWAGLVAVFGLGVSVTRSTFLANGDYGRVLEPWVGDLLIVVVSAVLVERAFRRGSGGYLLAGAVGLIVALTDFNAAYLSSSVESGLLVEGLILLAIGFATNVLRQRLRPAGGDAGSGPRPDSTTGPVDAEPTPVSEPPPGSPAPG
jgi:hypothetical protein